jgi:spore coat polysaccharide biosynthesis protein SpsF (cytidylyltransferase family)
MLMVAGQFGENDMSIGAIIQARIGFKRLPNSGVTVLENIIAGAKKVKFIDKIIIATSTDPADDIFEVLCNKSQAICFRGDLEKFLSCSVHAWTNYNNPLSCR